jgi:undecaprenyl pyrophosphate phosphatase UppP
MVIITIKLTTIVSSILTFQPDLIPMFFHMDSIRKFKSFIYSWRYITIVVIIIGIMGVRDNKGEKQLFVANGEGEFDQDVFALGSNFRT